MADYRPYAGIEGAALTGGEGGDALHNLLMGVLRGTVELPERVIKAAQATAPGLRREDFTDVPGSAQPSGPLIGGATEAALNLAGTGTAFAPFGSAGVFGGRLAQTADLNALARAERMQASGADKVKIWDETGWFQGGDGKWRFEIPDTDARMNPKWDREGVPNFEASKIAGQLWHDDLYKAYPDLRHVTGVTEKTNLTGGSYSAPVAGDARTFGRDETINIQAPTSPEARSVALHEMQHAIQQREGFAQGGSPAMFTQGSDAELARTALSYRRELEGLDPKLTPKQKDDIVRKRYEDAGAPDWFPSQDARSIAHDVEGNPADVLQRVMSLYGTDVKTSPFTPRQLYHELPGEVEARNVQARRFMSRDELRAHPPWITQDVEPRPIMSEIFGRGRVGMLEGPQMSAPVKIGEGIEARYPGLKLDVSTPGGPGEYAVVGRIVVPESERGKGFGTQAMRDLIAQADAQGIPLALSPSGDFGGNKKRLVEFYERLGFVHNKGRNKDFSIRETMYRPVRGGE